MPTDQLDVLTQSPAAPTATPAPAAAPSHTREEDDYLGFLRDALVSDAHPEAPRGWRLYATQKYLGLSILYAYALTAATVWAAPFFFKGDWIPVVFSFEAAVFGLPAAVVGAWFAWTSTEPSGAASQRRWRGRLLSLGVLYWGLQTSSAILHAAWNSLFIWR